MIELKSVILTYEAFILRKFTALKPIEILHT